MWWNMNKEKIKKKIESLKRRLILLEKYREMDIGLEILKCMNSIKKYEHKLEDDKDERESKKSN